MTDSPFTPAQEGRVRQIVGEILAAYDRRQESRQAYSAAISRLREARRDREAREREFNSAARPIAVGHIRDHLRESVAHPQRSAQPGPSGGSDA